MQLYMVPLAPNPVKVMLYMAEREALGVAFEIEAVIVNTHKGAHKTPTHLARNPFGSLPVLALDNGSFIRESRAIIDYLEDAFPENRLFSTDIGTRAQQRDIERICDVRLAEYLGVWVHAYKSPIDLPADPVRAAELEARMLPAFTFLNEMLADGRPFLCGDDPSPADCTLAAFFNFMRFTGKDLISDFPHLAGWEAHYRQRSVVAAVLTPERRAS